MHKAALTVDRIVASLKTICPNARRALVRMNMCGASKAVSMMLRIGWKEFRRLWMVPISSAYRSMRDISSCDLFKGSFKILNTFGQNQPTLCQICHLIDLYRRFGERPLFFDQTVRIWMYLGR